MDFVKKHWLYLAIGAVVVYYLFLKPCGCKDKPAAA